MRQLFVDLLYGQITFSLCAPNCSWQLNFLGFLLFCALLQDYKTFWTSFGKNLKLGCIEDSGNHKRLAPLLRFHSNKHEEDLISLDQYVEGMKPDQKAIYYLAADTIKSAKSAPFLEELVKRDLEVGWWLKAPWPCCCCSMMCQVVWENTELFGPKSDYHQF